MLRKELFHFIEPQGVRKVKVDDVIPFVESHVGLKLAGDRLKESKKHLRVFLAKLNERWLRAKRMTERFVSQNYCSIITPLYSVHCSIIMEY